MSAETRKHAVLALFAAAVLFVPAGTLAWPQAWVYLIVFNGCSVAMGLWLRRTNPALLAERMKSPVSTNQSPRDRRIMIAMLIAWILWHVVMALDARRFGWSHMPLAAHALGVVLILAAFAGWVLVLKENSFASTEIRLQTERAQTVISSGPYAVVRHPMYAFTLPLLVGAPLLLGSWLGLAGIAVLMPLLMLRTLGEETLLIDGLPGYRAYTAMVRYRLVPGVW
jgi:protein-S-isoprenylcysteine O-methyltransferase Ste14